MPLIRKSAYRLIAGSFVLLVANITISLAQQEHASAQSPKAASAAGRTTFNSYCAGCHGLDGSGSDKAANIAANSRASRISDADLSGIISNGIPETGMPAFRNLSPDQIRAVVGYARSLQGKSAIGNLPGDPERGREIFFGKGDCSSCHAVSGEGGFLGPDLTEYGATASAGAIRDEIVRSPRVPSHGFRRALIITASGDRLEGLVRNEDNFSVQLQTRDGDFHLFKRSDLKGFEHLDGSLMPSTYRNRLSESELNDLVSYLMKTPDPNKTAREKEKDDFE
jgi:cytochrome c oxidase cbb3-type subunit 3